MINNDTLVTLTSKEVVKINRLLLEREEFQKQLVLDSCIIDYKNSIIQNNNYIIQNLNFIVLKDSLIQKNQKADIQNLNKSLKKQKRITKTVGIIGILGIVLSLFAFR